MGHVMLPTEMPPNFVNTTTTTPGFIVVIPPTVHMALTLSILAVAAILTCVVAFYIARIYYYGHKKLTYFNVSLASCLFWGLLRIILLCTYAAKTHVASVGILYYVLLFVVPYYLQFAPLSLVVLYFFEVSLKGQHIRERQRSKIIMRCATGLSNLAFFVINVYCAGHIAKKFNDTESSSDMMKIRVAVTETFTMLCCVFLMFSTLRIRSLIKQRKLVQGQGVTGDQLLIFTAVICPLFFSRFVYNIIAINEANVDLWGYRWTYLSDAKNRNEDDSKAFFFFLMVLFLWEILPIAVFVWFFRVPKNRTYQEIRPDAPLQPQSVQFGDQDSDDGSDEEFSVGPGLLEQQSLTHVAGSYQGSYGTIAEPYSSYPPPTHPAIERHGGISHYDASPGRGDIHYSYLTIGNKGDPKST